MTLPLLRPIVRVIIVAIVAFVGLTAAPSMALAQPPPETVEYYATDALGSVRVVFTPTGEVIGRSDYLPFGDTQEQSGMLPRQRFTGQERDGVAGLDDFNARSLQMRTGRMNRPDPLFGNALVNPQRWNRYAYVQNNPLRYTDPSGMDAVDMNKLLQDCWGLQAWDDFSQDSWAAAWGYSYGPFSPTLVELSRQGVKWDRLQFDPEGGGVVAGFSQDNATRALNSSVFTNWSADIGQGSNVTLAFDIAKGTLTVADGRVSNTMKGVTSGRGGCVNDPACSGRKGAGPIPPGSYTLWVPEISNPSFAGDIARNLLGDWGDWRVPVFPVPGTETHGRSGFFLHGGSLRGSAGCIDIGGGPFGSATTTQLLSTLKGDFDGIVWLTVR